MAWTDAIITELLRGADPGKLKVVLEGMDVDKLKELFVAGDVLQQQLGDTEEGTFPECDGEGCEACDDTGMVDGKGKKGGDYSQEGGIDEATKKPMGHAKKLKKMKDMIMLVSVGKKKPKMNTGEEN